MTSRSPRFIARPVSQRQPEDMADPLDRTAHPPMLSAATLAAYLASDYRVFVDEGVITLRIGERNPAICGLLLAHRAHEALFITACNPSGVRHGDAFNQHHQRELRAELAQAGYTIFAGEGAGSGDDWPPEPSVLVLDPAPGDSLELCRRFRQNAVVMVASDGMSSLLLHPDLQMPAMPG